MTGKREMTNRETQIAGIVARHMLACYMCVEMNDSGWDESDPCGETEYKACLCASKRAGQAAAEIENYLGSCGVSE
jgi:hypothetical protein